MRAQNVQPKSDERADEVQPIVFLTENGFEIVRRWEADHEPQPVDGTFPFLVTNPGDLQTDVTVQVADKCLQALSVDAGVRLPLSSSFWVICAERHLAEYLWLNNQPPSNRTLTVDCLDPDETILAATWARQPAAHD